MAQKILQLSRRYLKELADFQPMSALAWGLPGYESKFSDYSKERIRNHLKVLRQIKKEAGAARSGAFSLQEKLEKALLVSEIKLREKEWGAWKKFERDPTRYIGELIYGLWYLHLRVPSKSLKVEASLRRLRESGTVLHFARERLKNPPRLWTQIAVQEAKGYLEFLLEIRRELLRLAPRRRQEIRQAVAIGQEVGRAFLNFLQGTLLKRSRGKFSAGKGEYRFRLKHYHHYSVSPEELRRLGRKEFDKVKRQLQDQAAKINPEVPWHRLVETVKKKHPSQSDLLRTYRRETSRLRNFVLKKQLASIPRGERLQVIPTPVFTRHTIPYAAYVDPPMFRGKNHGTFFVTPVTAAKPKIREEILGEHNLPAIRVTALHEGYPGHHLQFAKQKEARGVLTKLFNCSSFYEGWALYCEEMMHEVGYYDAWGRLIQLKDKLWRACRILVDVGLHTGKMSDAKAVAFMAKELKMSRASARADVNWYSLSPTIPQSYYTGMLRIRALREKYRKQLGKAFSLKKFHDAFLQYGAIPIPLVERALLRARHAAPLQH